MIHAAGVIYLVHVYEIQIMDWAQGNTLVYEALNDNIPMDTPFLY